MKQTIYLIMLIILIGLAMGEICEEIQQPNVQCQMLTPSLVCSSYNYDIIDNNGNIVVSDTLSNLNASIYYFNFNQSLGDYIIRLCDNSTREIYVQTSEVDYNMNQLAIVFIIIAYFVILFYLATTWDYNLVGNNPENKKKNVIQAMLTILGIWLSYGLLQLANLIAISSSMIDLYSLIETFLTISMYLNITISSYMAIFLLKNLLQAFNGLGKKTK